jgi:hypothetical protein
MIYLLCIVCVLALAGFALRTPKSALVSEEEYEKYFRTHIMGMK